ncbi:hypothetical protein HY768_07365 [candidate division TA06 bacterium]|uniref:Lipoprotein n=1 Tax=candidate division TA06 bacterium TaxID=2250710 RepID=A0A933I9F6_UNCT6|nr:hypothetical protein [candidate division TA06 bacterium]
MKTKTLLVFLIFVAILAGCSKNDAPTESTTVPKTTFSYFQYSCSDKSSVKADSFAIFVQANDVIIWHYNLVASCCDTIRGEFKQSAETLKVYEKYDGIVCYCLCSFILSYKIGDLKSGSYFLKIFKETDSLLLKDTTIVIP